MAIGDRLREHSGTSASRNFELIRSRTVYTKQLTPADLSWGGIPVAEELDRMEKEQTCCGVSPVVRGRSVRCRRDRST